MSNALNLYATKVFAEHPLALWALDEKNDYISLLDSEDQLFEENRDECLASWEVFGATVVDGKDEEIRSPQFLNVPINKVNSNNSNGTMSFLSNFVINSENIDNVPGSIGIGFYVLLPELPIFNNLKRPINVKFGFEHTLAGEDLDDPEVEIFVRIRDLDLTVEGSWVFISDTFTLPTSFDNLRIFIEFSYPSGVEEYSLFVNGVSAGQWCEEFHATSLGIIPKTVEELGIDSPFGGKALIADSYGLQDQYGYYLFSGNFMPVRNIGMPLVFGAENSTVVFPNNGIPALIVPAYGFLNNLGKYKNLTLEFWCQIKGKSEEPRRIVGPIGSNDGIFVEGPFIKVKVGKYIGSHYVGEWDRPMLINLRVGAGKIVLVINGEDVIIIDAPVSDLNLPEKDSNNKSLDWIGFYAYEDVPAIKIDAVGIYPYDIPAIVSKRRVVYGQAIDFPENIKGINAANSVAFDYSFADYDKNYNYPKSAQWNNGVIDNFSTERSYLSSPAYSLPSFIFSNKEEEQWFEDLSNLQQLGEETFFSLVPNSGWNNTGGHIYFPTLNMLDQDVKAFYCTFERIEDSEEIYTLFEMEDSLLKRGISVKFQNGNIIYNFYSKNSQGIFEEEVINTYKLPPSTDKFYVGLDVDKISAVYGKQILSFFGNKKNIKIYVGGNRNLQETFPGKIFNVAFCSEKNLNKINRFFSDLGFYSIYENVFSLFDKGRLFDSGDNYFGEDPSFWENVLDGGNPYDFITELLADHVASYTLITKFNIDQFVVDIAADSYWEDYVPLSYFGKFVKNAGNQKVQDLDFIQFNIDYPKILKFVEDKYNTSSSLVKTYVSFSRSRSGTNVSREYRSEFYSLDSTGVVEPGSEWIDENNEIIAKYELVDDSIIYPPPGVDFKSLIMTIYIEATTPGIISNPIKIRSMQLASKSLESDINYVGTRFGKKVIPFRQFGVYTDYKSRNPFTTYKGSTPHLYLTSKSGAKIRGEYTVSGDRGFIMSVNERGGGFYKMGAIQLSLRYDEPLFPLTPVEIFEIDHVDGAIKFYLLADSPTRKRGQIYAINAQTGTFQKGIVSYLNGNVVKRPTMSSQLWTTFGFAFSPSLDFSNYRGAVKITSPVLFNNVSHYQVSAEDEVAQIGFRKWIAVKQSPEGSPITWDFWANTEGLEPDPLVPNKFLKEYQWVDILILGEADDPDPLNPASIYRQFVGTDSFVVDTDYNLNITNTRYTMYKDLRWNTITVDSV
jgi:hypothetical protein